MDTDERPKLKSERTRQAIEGAARELFAANGFDATTVRDIAAQAKIDPAMIIRYFGSKDALFARVAAPDLRLPDVRDVAPDRIGETIVRHFLDQWEGSVSASGLPVLLRSAASNEAAAERLREVFAAQVAPMIRRLAGPGNAAQTAGLVSSQLLGVALTRYVLKLPPVVAMSLDTLVREVGATVQRYMESSALSALEIADNSRDHA